MKATILDGKACAAEVKSRVKAKVDKLKSEGIFPVLATVLVGNNPSSKIYLGKKHESCSQVGIKSENIQLPDDSSEAVVVKLVEKLNRDEKIHGILVQLPLPNGIRSHKVIETISPLKDVDGLNPYNIGQITYRRETLIPCTPKGVVTLLEHNNIPIAGQNIVILGRSNLVGKPLQLLLTNLDATVTLCHSKTKKLAEESSRADILVSAVGTRPSFITTADMIKEGAVVIDVGINLVNGKICGDVDFDGVVNKASYITPVPGGVGPMTVATLLENTLIAVNSQI